MADDPDSIVRKTVSLPARVWKEIEDFQFESRLKKDVDAVRRLVEVGLKHWVKDLNGEPVVRIGTVDGDTFQFEWDGRRAQCLALNGRSSQFGEVAFRYSWRRVRERRFAGGEAEKAWTRDAQSGRPSWNSRNDWA